MEEKLCKRCNTRKKISEFAIDKTKADNLNTCCKECKSLYDKLFYKINKQKIIKKTSVYSKNNKDKINERERNRRKNDINYRLSSTIRNRIRGMIKGTSKRAVNELGCTLEEYRKYLEQRFTPEMSWDNHGNYWHIDHIFPLSKFNLDNPEEFLLACNYTNTQPLEAKENITKSDNICHDIDYVLEMHYKLLVIRGVINES